MASPASVNENGRNCCQLVCLRCQSKILPPNTGIFEVCRVETFAAVICKGW